MRLSRSLRAGAVHINGGAYEYGSPFGGYKASGNGRETETWVSRTFSKLKWCMDWRECAADLFAGQTARRRVCQVLLTASLLKGSVIAAFWLVRCTHAQQWSDYKCYDVNKGVQWVHLFEMDPQNPSTELAALPGRLVLDSFGRTLAEVREVKECVLLDASFSSLKARTLDENTPK